MAKKTKSLNYVVNRDFGPNSQSLSDFRAREFNVTKNFLSNPLVLTTLGLSFLLIISSVSPKVK